MGRAWFVAVVWMGLFVVISVRVSARTLVDVRGIYEREIAKIDGEHEAALGKAVEAYGVLLSRAVRDAKNAGDLDALLKLQEEERRFETEETPAEMPAPDSLDAVALMVGAYARRKKDADKEKHGATVVLSQKYIAMLEKMSKELVRGDKINEALEVKKEIERAEFSLAVASAALKQVLPERPARQAPPSARPKPKPALSTLKGPVLHYTFDDDGKMVKDSAAGGYDASLHGAQYVDGIKGRGVRFSSSQTYMTCNSSRLSCDGWREVTLSLWCRLSGYSTYGRLLSRSKIGEGGGAFGMNVGGRASAASFGVRLQGGQGVGVTMPKLAANGEWRHIAGVYDGKSVIYYVDGRKAASESVPQTLRHKPLEEVSGASLVVGKCGTRWTWSDTYVVGTVDEIRLYDRALSKLELQQLHKSRE